MPSTADRPVLRRVTATTLALTGLTCLAYAVWLLTARRAIFAAIDRDGPSAVSLEVARASDTVNTTWLWMASVLLVVALASWLRVRLVFRQRFGPVGFAGVCLVAAGALVVVVGSVLAWLTGAEPGQANRAAAGYSVIGAGFLLTALGLLAGVVSLASGPPGERTPYLGYAGWGSEDRNR